MYNEYKIMEVKVLSFCLTTNKESTIQYCR